MKKCVKIMVKGVMKNFSLQDLLAHARTSGIEGVAQRVEDQSVRVIVNGLADQIDAFLDFIHKQDPLLDVVVESFLAPTDFRGVFRVIE